MELLEKCVDDAFFAMERRADWMSSLSCQVDDNTGHRLSCRVFTSYPECCYVSVNVQYLDEINTEINVYVKMKWKPIDMDAYAFDVLKVWKNALCDVDKLEECALAFAHRHDLYNFDPNGRDIERIVFVNGELQTDLGTF